MQQTTSPADMILFFFLAVKTLQIFDAIFQIWNTNNLNARKQIQLCGPAA